VEWWEKLEEERRQAGRPFSMLIFKRDAKSTCCMVSVDFFNFLIDHMAGLNPLKTMDIYYKKMCVTIFPYEDFLETAHPSIFD